MLILKNGNFLIRQSRFYSTSSNLFASKRAIFPNKSDFLGSSKLPTLLIVESPTKAKTIQKFLDESKFKVFSSQGHIREIKSILPENDFEIKYRFTKSGEAITYQLKKEKSQSSNVILASDKDREGEGIAWHLSQVLGLPIQAKNRIVFQEITPTSLTKALETPRSIDMNLVRSQQTRQIIDRLTGFELSPLLWKHIKFSLSAGRVQSVAARLVIEREKERKKLEALEGFEVNATFLNPRDKLPFKAELNSILHKKDNVSNFFEKLKLSKFIVSNLTETKEERNAPPPFKTSTLQQEASHKLGFSPKFTMRLAQKLYELGYISYHRTDSITIPELVEEKIYSIILHSYGKEYIRSESKKKESSKFAQEAHYAIYPTNLNANLSQDKNISPTETRLYNLIKNRTLASQMAPVKYHVTKVKITPVLKKSENELQDYYFTTTFKKVVFPGFTQLFSLQTKPDEEKGDLEGDEESSLRKLSKYPSLSSIPPALHSELTFDSIVALQTFSKLKGRYSQASLVQQLEEKGIGRPSTYAGILQIILERGYVVEKTETFSQQGISLTLSSKGQITESTFPKSIVEKNKLVPTDIGIMVNDFLKTHFSEIINYEFTSEMENFLDKIASGQASWVEISKNFFFKLRSLVDKVKLLNVPFKKALERDLGTHPTTGALIKTRMARYGFVIEMEGNPPKYVPISKELMDTINLENALSLLELPKSLGSISVDQLNILGKEKLPREVEVILHPNFVSIEDNKFWLPKDSNILTFTLQDALQLIKEKSNTVLKMFSQEAKIMEGKKGRPPYFIYKNQICSIPKERINDIPNLTLEECLKFLEEKGSTKRVFKKKLTRTIKSKKISSKKRN